MPDEKEDNTISIAVMQVDYTTRDTIDGTEKPVIHIFGRNEKGEQEHVRVHGFKPYFYAPRQEVNRTDLSGYRVEKTVNGFTGIRGTELTKIVMETPRQVGYARGEFDKTFEDDVQFPNRFLIDNGIVSGIKVPEKRNGDRIDCRVKDVEPVDMTRRPRMNIFDIEVEDRNGFPEDGDEEIISITSWDSRIDEYVIWLYDPQANERIDDVFPSVSKRGEGQWIYQPNGDDIFPDYEPIDDDIDQIRYRVAIFDEEAKMLDQFLTYIEQTDPDLMTGWNFDDFDMPYLLDRLEILDKENREYDLKPERFSRLGEVWRSDWGGPDVKGRVIFDLLEAYKRTKFSEMESYRLDAIGEVELGVGKEVYDGKLGGLWENNLRQLLEYNLRDVELCVELDRKQAILAFWNEVRSFVGCQLEDAPIPSDAVDMYVLQKVHGTFVLPSKGQADYEDYEGGAVFDPITGVRENVNVLDLKSLYPMCMVTINASPETKVDPDEYDGETFVSPPIKDTDGSAKQIHFRKDEDGIIREMVDELLGERDKKKALRNQHEPGSEEYNKFDRQQGSVKVIMNSLYGVLGWERFRLYDKEMGAAVTATGRAVIQETERISEDLGYEVVYGDTDSVMLELGHVQKDEVEELTEAFREEHPELVDEETDSLVLGEKFCKAYPNKDEDELWTLAATIAKGFEIEKAINTAYDDFAEDQLHADADGHRFLIESEKLYRRFFQAGRKKRYSGHVVWKEGKYVDSVGVKGFEAQRSDVSQITEEAQREILRMIVYGEDESEIKEYAHGIVNDFKEGALSLEQIGIPGGIGQALEEYENPTAQVRGAMYANVLLDQNLAKGSKPKRVYLRKVHPDFYKGINKEDFKTSYEQEIYNEFRRDPDVICFEYEQQVPKEFETDWDVMLEKTIRNPIEKILEAVGISWQEVKSNQTQTGLENFI